MILRNKIFNKVNSVAIFLLLLVLASQQLFANVPVTNTPTSDGEPDDCQVQEKCEDPCPNNSGTTTEQDKCNECKNDDTTNSCISLLIPFGERALSAVDLRNGMLKLKYDEPIDKIKRPTGLTFDSPFSMYIASKDYRSVTLINSAGKQYKFMFNGSNGYLNGEFSRLRVTKLDADRKPTTSSNPKYYQYYQQQISSVLFDAQTGQVVEYCNKDGIIIGKDDYVLGGLEILRKKPNSNPETHYIKQVYSRINGLINITDIGSYGYTIKIYNAADVGAKDSNGFYTIDSEAKPRKEWQVKANNYYASNVDIIEKVNGVNYLTNFKYVYGKYDWVMTKDGGNIKVIKEKFNKNGNISIEKILTKNGKGKLIYAKNTLWKTFPNIGKRKISESIGEEDDQLTTYYAYSMPESRYNYYEGSSCNGVVYAVKSAKVVKYVRSSSMVMSNVKKAKLGYIAHPKGNYGSASYRRVIKFRSGFSDYDKSAARLVKVEKPIGTWTSYEYRSTDGKKEAEYTGIGDASFSSYGNAKNAIKTQYHYNAVYSNDTFKVDQSPRKIVKSVNGNIISKTYKGKYREGDYLVEINEEASSPNSSVGNASNAVEKILYYDDKSLFYNGDIYRKISEDGSVETYTYERGNFNYAADLGSSTFTPDTSGYALKKTVIYGTEANPDGVAFKSFKKVIIKDSSANEVMVELYVKTATGYEKIGWKVMQYNNSSQLIKKVTSNNAQLDQLWSCCNVSSETDAEGKEFVYGYDTMKRRISETKKGVNGQADLVVTYTYDAQANVLTETKTDGTKSLTTSYEYDTAGRKTKKIDEKGRTTIWKYELGGRKVTETKPSGETIITEKYKDGKIKSITGSDVLARYYTYGYTSGQSWEKINYNHENSSHYSNKNSLRWTKTTYNMLGQVIKTERSGYNGIVVSEMFYNDKGYLIKETNTGSADTLYVYDEIGNLFRKGLDVNHNGVLDLDSMDTIQEYENVYEKDANGDWWFKRANKIYATANSGNATTLSATKTRLTGFGENKTAEIVSIDAYGNQTVTTTTIDRANKKVTRVTNLPNSTANSEVVAINGKTKSVKSQFGQTINFNYNSFGERVSKIDSFVGQTTYIYDNYGRKTQEQDPAGNIIKYTYNADDQLVTIENAQGKKVYYQYNNRGQAIRQWGGATYPLEKAYDAYGNLTQLKTYRTGNGWNSATWPSSTGSADITTWTYDEASGMLTSKTYADGKSTGYTYDVNGKLLTRKWARNDFNGTRLTTSYSYDVNTGSLLNIDYSDNTPSVSYTYNRAGSPSKVTDVVGTRTFNYNDKLALESEEITGLYSKTINYSYSTTQILGRPTGVNIGAEYVSNYGYDELGRVSSVSAGNEVYTYSYKANSPLLDKYSTANGFERKYSYETNRYLLTDIENKFGTTNTISKYSFVNDSLGRRNSMTKNGSVYNNTATTDSYTYNDRSELINATNSADTAFNFQYGFDGLGNRTSYTKNGLTTSYTTNNLNQYSSINTNGSAFSPDYNEDGCMLNYNGWTYTYNGENRLVKAEKGTQKLEFKYDYMGRRVEKKVFENNTLTKHQKFVYNGYKLIEQLNALTNDSITSKFIWSGDNLLALQQSGNNYSYIADANKNIRQLVNNNTGAVVNNYEYTPFGKLYSSNEQIEQPFKFSSEYADTETNLVYYNYRYYNPIIGRWTKRDPIREYGGINIYAFINNNIINYIDLLGLKKSCCGTKEYDSEKQCCKNDQIKDKWLVCIYTNTAHAWVTVQRQKKGSKALTIGRWHSSRGGSSGVQYNREKGHKYTSRRCKIICGAPQIDSTGGYEIITGNCSSFASEAWESMTRETLSPSNGFYHSPNALSDSINNANEGVNDNWNGETNPSKSANNDASSSSRSGSSGSSSGSSGSAASSSSLPGSSIDSSLHKF